MQAVKVLAVQAGKTKYEVYTMNPGDTFPNFGGRTSGLVARKTGSIVIRERSSVGLRDTEYDLHDASVWHWVATLVNTKPEDNVKAECPLPYTEG